VFNPATQTYDSLDITEDILSLGVTEPAPNLGSSTFQIIEPVNYVTNNIDSRSIVKLQRFMIGGAVVPTSGATSPNGYISSNSSWSGGPYNYVHVADVPAATACGPGGGTPSYRNAGNFPNGYTEDNRVHWRAAVIGTTTQVECIVPFPIEMFDTREGLYNDTSTVFDPTAAGNYGTNRVPYAGVMSMVDIDIYNLKRFLDGNFDSYMPTGTTFAAAAGRGLRGSDIPNANGWVFYVSDRRGDGDFDGEYDMEDIFGNNDGTLQPGEDVNKNTILNYDFSNEAVRYNGSSSDKPTADIAAVFDHRYYRRGVRIINSRVLPGIYDSATPSNSKGFTFASENGVYVWGDFNATGVASVGSPTPASDYLPQNTASHVSASIAADSVTILSNNWRDGRSFAYPFSLGSRNATETTLRFAMLTGDSLTSLGGSPNQGGGDPRMNGGVHNFKRFLEDWGGSRLNYVGSLINLFNSRNNNGAYKCCNNVYSPPVRNWVFDATFLDINRLPPGTPFFQAIQITGFQRVN
jgi:hypothetical protein